MVDVKDSVGSTITLIIGMGVALLVMIFVGSLGGQTYQTVESDLDLIGNNVVANESFTPINASSVSLVHSSIHSGTLYIINSSDVHIANANFTIDYDTGDLILLNNAFNNTVLRASYTWGEVAIGNSAKASIVSSFEALQKTGQYLPIIVLAVVIFLVLALVMGFSMGQNKGGGGTAL